MSAELPEGTEWSPAQTSVVSGERLGFHGNFIAPNVMAALDANGSLRYRYYEHHDWIESNTAALGDDWAHLGYDNLQVRRNATNSSAIDVRWPVPASKPAPVG